MSDIVTQRSHCIHKLLQSARGALVSDVGTSPEFPPRSGWRLLDTLLFEQLMHPSQGRQLLRLSHRSTSLSTPIAVCLDNRATRNLLRGSEGGRRGVRTTTTDLVAVIDSMDAKRFASYMAEDCVLGFGNVDEVVGRDAIEAAIAGFFETIKGLRHDVLHVWEVDDTTILQFVVTYTRHDGDEVTVPAVTIYRRRGDLIEDYRVYVDLAPVYA